MSRHKSDELAAFVTRGAWDNLPAEGVRALKARGLEASAVRIRALSAESIAAIREQVAAFARPLTLEQIDGVEQCLALTRTGSRSSSISKAGEGDATETARAIELSREDCNGRPSLPAADT